MAAESPATASDQRPPRVFLSYSHDSPEHSARVLALARQLRRDGVDARIDQFDAFPPEGWPQWCARQILDSDFVVLICTATYRERFLGYEKPGTGRGVKWEGKILQGILYREERNTRFQPVVFSKDDEQFIPESVAGMTWVLLADFNACDPGYAALVKRFTGGRQFAPLPDLAPIAEPTRPRDASVATGEVADDLALQLGKLDDILAEQRILRAEQEKLTAVQVEHESKSRKRQRVLVAVLVVLAICALAGGPWIVREIRKAFAETKAIVADPVVLRAKLEEKIEETFEKKKGELLGAKAASTEIDALYKWRDRAKGQVAEAVAFITARAGDVNSPIIKKAAAILEERGADAALEFLDTTLKAERQRRREEGRQLAEASMMKAGMHRLRFENEEEERAIRDANADAPDWWQPHNALGMILHRRAEWKPSEQEYEDARKSMGADGEATVLNNLALLYQATNRLAEAEPLMERVLKIDEKSFGPEHPNVATSLNNLALLYQATNRLAEAEPLMERVLKIDEKSFGPEHPDVARDLNNLALLYQATNRLAEGEALMRRALKIDETSFGPVHPKVATKLNNLAQLYKAANRLAEAEPLMERALKIDEKSHGSDRPDVARDLNNLALLYQDTDRLAEAEPLMKRHLVIFIKFTRKTGHPHPHVNAAIRNVKILLGKMSLPATEITQRLAAAGREAGYTDEEFAALLQRLGE